MAGSANRTLPADPTYQTVRTWQRGKTTEQNVKTLLGMPTIINSDGQRTDWYYKRGNTRLSVQFNPDHTVNAYQYIASDAEAASTLETRQVSLLVAGTSDLDLVRSLGEPTYASLSASGQEMTYRNFPAHRILRVRINENAGLVTNYFFSEEGPKTASIDPENVMRIDRNKTTSADVTSLFGSPAQVSIDKDKETWLYSSAGAQLVITFEKSGNQTVSAYQYARH